MTKYKVLFFVPIALVIVTTVVAFMSHNLPPALSEYVNIQDVESVDLSPAFYIRSLAVLIFFASYIGLFFNKKNYLVLYLISFVCLISAKISFGPVVQPAIVEILNQLTIFSCGIVLGYAYLHLKHEKKSNT